MLLFSISAVASQNFDKSPKHNRHVDLIKIKKKINEGIDHRISMLNEFKRCVNKAQSPAEIKECRRKFKEKSRQMKQYAKKHIREIRERPKNSE
ncbi:hypothetical protein [Deferribacter desulfuricans]|uniref:hypothetical protein n=1 Tax=Deferribacter desulfuricans TaxID=197162 RepID=UPI00059B832B|nr:hypothetical protein [Deferribacter desulfuricans]